MVARQGILIAIIKLARVKVSRLRLQHMRGETEHMLGNFLAPPNDTVDFDVSAALLEALRHPLQKQHS